MEYKQRAYPLFSACGLNCGLCPRYQMQGASKCPGCAGDGFLTQHPTCGLLSCSQRRGRDYCYECDEFPCKKYDGADQSDSFITHLNQLKDLERAKTLGMDRYRDDLEQKITLLEHLRANYDDGRRKSFFCLAVNLLELPDLESVLAQLALEVHSAMALKEKAALAAGRLQAMAEARGILLTLRKKSKPG